MTTAAIGIRGLADAAPARLLWPVACEIRRLAAAALIACAMAVSALGGARAQMLYRQPPAPPSAVPALPCATADDAKALEAIRSSWAAAYAQFLPAESAMTKAEAAVDATHKASTDAAHAYHDADTMLQQAEKGGFPQAVLSQLDAAQKQALAAMMAANHNDGEAESASISATKTVSELLVTINIRSSAWWALIAQIGDRNCTPPQTPAVLKPSAPPEEPRAKPKPPAPAAKTPCPACQKLDGEIEAIDANIAALERSNASMRKYGNPNDPNVQNTIKGADQKITDLKKQRDALVKKKANCALSCAAPTATDGEVANTGEPPTESGSVLQGAVLQGIGVNAPAPGQPNRKAESGESDQSTSQGGGRPQAP